MLSLLGGLLPLARGEIEIGGVPMSERNAATLRQRIGWMGQKPHVFAGSVEANVALGRAGIGAAEVGSAMQFAGLESVAQAHPGTALGEGGGGLSGGEAVRLALARIVVHPGADLLLVDEPTAHLDTETAARVADALLELARGKTLIVATSRPRCLRPAWAAWSSSTLCRDGEGRMTLWRDLRPVVRPFLAAQPRALLLGVLLAAPHRADRDGAAWPRGLVHHGDSAGRAQCGDSDFLRCLRAVGGYPLAGDRPHGPSRYAERLVTHDATFGVLAALRVRLFRGWAQAEAAHTLLARPSRLLFRLTSDIDALESLYLRLVVPAFAALGAAVLAGVVLGFMQLGMGIALALWLVACGWGMAVVVARRARRPAVLRGHAIEALRARAVDLVAGQTDLVMAGRLDAQREAVVNADVRLAKADVALNRLETAAGVGYSVAGTLSLVAVLLAVGWLTGEGVIGAPAAALALLIALTAVEPFAALRRGALDAGRTWLAVRRLGPRMGVADASNAPTIDDGSTFALRLKDLIAGHAGSAAPVFDRLSLDIAAGERVALIGPSGAGKSTLLAIATGEDDADRRDDRATSRMPADPAHGAVPTTACATTCALPTPFRTMRACGPCSMRRVLATRYERCRQGSIPHWGRAV